MDLWSDFIQYMVGLFEPVSAIPYSTPFIVAVSIILSLCTTIATVKMTDADELRANMEETRKFREKLNEARKTMDPILLQEVMDDQTRIMQINSSMMFARMKPTCIFIIPFIILYGILGAVYGANPVAILPFNPQDVFFFLEGSLGVSVDGVGFGLYLWTWYMFAGISLGGLIRKAFKIDLTM